MTETETTVQAALKRAIHAGVRDARTAVRAWEPGAPVPKPDLDGYGLGYPNGEGGWVLSSHDETNTLARYAYERAFRMTAEDAVIDRGWTVHFPVGNEQGSVR